MTVELQKLRDYAHIQMAAEADQLESGLTGAALVPVRTCG